jgi:hypothetical protein
MGPAFPRLKPVGYGSQLVSRLFSDDSAIKNIGD